MLLDAELSHIEILIGILSLFFIVQVYYHLRYFSAISFYKKPSKRSTKKIPISVIIAARNESDNLQEFLESILTQDYSDYEVIVVNDCSYDNSADVLKGYQTRYKHLKVVDLEEVDKYKHGKKFALTLGIKAAKHEHLIFTDADCMAVSKEWISLIQAGFTEGTEIVLGYSPYIKTNTLLNAFSRFETFFTALQYLSFSIRKQTYMGVGRNLAYTKTLFFKNKGFAAHMHLISGDDDLFVNATATKSNVSVCIEPNSFVYTPSKTNWSDYFLQKLRHLPDAKEYKTRDKVNLTLLSSTALFFWLSLLLSFIVQLPLEISIGFLMARLLLSGVFYYTAMKKLGLKDLFPFYPILEIAYFLIIPIWSFISLFLKPQKWK
jgi:glycosyltransferase involved in cell wall biosynthesis